MKKNFVTCICLLAGVLIAVMPFTLTMAVQGSALSYEQALALIESDDLNQQMDGVDAMVLGGDERAGALLLRLFQEPKTDGVLKITAAYSLGVLGVESARDVLISALEQDLEQRTGAWSGIIPALGELRSVAAVPVLLKALNKRDDRWLGREMAATALGQIGSSLAVPDLMTAARLVDTRGPAIVALAAIGDSRAAAVFLDALQEGEEPDIIRQATDGLRRLGDAAVPEMARRFESYHREYPETAMRVRLCRLLGESGSQQAQEALRRVVQDRRDGWVQKCAREQLAQRK
jgi:HEAT repeat protein